MTIQNYLMVGDVSKVVENIILWDGNTETWTPPPLVTMLVQADTLAMIWKLNEDSSAWELAEEMGVGKIGFTWDGSKLTTNEPKPIIPKVLQE